MVRGRLFYTGLPACSKIPYKEKVFCELFKHLQLFSRLKRYLLQMTSPIRRLFALAVAIAVALTVAAGPARGDDETFPRPAAFEPDIAFWVSIFTEYSSDEGVLHDSRHLGVVYERIPMPATTSRRVRNRQVNVRRDHYKAVLGALAGGKRDKLTAEERRVLELWPPDVSNATLRAAAGRLRYQQGLSDRFRDGLRRSGRWRDHVNAEFGKRGVPTELAALPHVESSYNPDARSHVGASGIWQFTRSTGRRYMQIDHVLDERNDPFTATEAAAELLAYNYSITGNWPMAITAYNHGLSGARRAMRRHGNTAYVEIMREYRSRTFGFASRNFYLAFLAAMQVDQDPERYFPGLTPDKPVDYATFVLQDYVPAESLAAAFDVTERQLARHNPSLQATIWQGSKHLPRKYRVRIPAGMLDQPIAELIAAIPEDQRFGRQLPDLYHTVARGDTLSEIADEYATSVSTLVALNNLRSRNRIRAGQRLRLPAAGPAPAIASTQPAPSEPAPSGPAATEPAPSSVVVADAPALPALDDVMEPVDEAVATGATDTAVATMADDASAPFLGPIALLSDPSDYTVADDLSIEVHPLETLGHYGDWLGIKTQRLRDINGFAFRTPVEVGQRIKLDFSQVDAEAFENLRLRYHREQQDTFFRNHTIVGIKEHVIGRGESVWILSLREYDVPVWLFRQYNPELDLHSVTPGTRISFPVLLMNDRS